MSLVYVFAVLLYSVGVEMNDVENLFFFALVLLGWLLLAKLGDIYSELKKLNKGR